MSEWRGRHYGKSSITAQPKAGMGELFDYDGWLDGQPPLIPRRTLDNLVMNALISLDLALAACRLFSSNTLPIIAIMLNRDCKVEDREWQGMRELIDVWRDV